MGIIDKAINKYGKSRDTVGVEKGKQFSVDDDESYQERIHIDVQQLTDAETAKDVFPHLADEYRRIKRPLLANAFDAESQLVKRGNLVLVTSSLPGEGKSFTATNLALSIATERDRTVLLIDADVTKSKVSKLLGLEGRRGLVDMLVDEAVSPRELIVKTDFPGLSIIPSGGSHPQITELLASERMADVLDEISSRYSNRLVLFDAPPILATPETQVLCDRMGQIVFVVEMGTTPRNVVDQALDLLPNDDKAVGLVLNKARKLSGVSGYGDGYYGGY